MYTLINTNFRMAITLNNVTRSAVKRKLDDISDLSLTEKKMNIMENNRILDLAYDFSLISLSCVSRLL